MDASSFGASSKFALPSQFCDGNSQTPNGGSPLQTSVGVKELERLTASIHALNNGRRPIDLSLPQELQTTNQESRPSQLELHRTGSVTNSTNLNVAPRDPRDKTSKPQMSSTSRPASPYTLNPPIDFDGLSWPCELWPGFPSEIAAEGSE